MAMKVGNIDVGGMFSGMGGQIGTAFTWFFWGIIIITLVSIVGWLSYNSFKNKSFYVYPVTLTTMYENGTQRDRTDIKGGKFINSKGVWDFKCKIPKQWRTKELGYTPDFSKADNDNRLNFITSGDGTLWQQYDKRLISTETVDGVTYTLLIKPVPTENKTVTVNAIKNWRETVDKTKLTTFAIAIGAFIIMVIAHLISLYIQTKIKCGTP